LDLIEAIVSQKMLHDADAVAILQLMMSVNHALISRNWYKIAVADQVNSLKRMLKQHKYHPYISLYMS